MSIQQEIHVIFGSGPLGQSVMRELLQRGKKVRIVSRHPNEKLPPQVESVCGDLYNPEIAEMVSKGADIIYQCAQPAYTKWVDEFPQLMKSVLQAATINRAKLILGDNLYMYGEVNGKIHEGLPDKTHTQKGKVRAEIAAMALEAHNSGKVRVAIGRGSDFFGPLVLDSTMGERVFIPALNGKTASVMGSLDLPHTYTYINDFGKGLVTLGEHDEAFGQIWHVPNPETLTQREFVQRISNEIGSPIRVKGMGKLMLQFGGLFIPEARESIEMLYEFEKPFIVDDSKFRRAFGFQPTPLDQAICETISWYREYLNHRPEGKSPSAKIAPVSL